MSRKLTRSAAVAGAAAAAAFAAYGVGSQVGGGSADAAKSGGSSNNGNSRSQSGTAPRDRGLAALAQRLGVSEDKLRTALEELRSAGEGPGERHADLAAALAKELGVDQAKVEAALQQARPDRPNRRNGPPNPGARRRT